MTFLAKIAGVSGAAILLNSGSQAADLSVSTDPLAPQGPRHEVRGGVLYHDFMEEEEGLDLNAEYLSRFAAFGLFIPRTPVQLMFRPHIGATLNTSGDTSYGYAGYSLTVNLGSRLFLEGSFGGMVHNGDSVSRDGDLSLGCNVMFRESASLGVRVTDHWNVSAMIVHGSNAGMCNANNGITNAGIRLGYSF